MTYKQAWMAGPGPRTWPQALLLAAKGFCMGGADIIPGVSGGTMAFITGIYEDLLLAVRSVNVRFLLALARLDFSAALAEAHFRFLVPLLAGIGLALVSMAGLMHWLLTNHPVPVWSLFLGLVGASVLVVGREVRRWNAGAVLALGAGAVAAWCIVGLIPVTTPEDPWFLFLCGGIAICAMILPGISGSFLLLILGKYEFVTAALRNPLDAGNLAVLAVFATGCLVGIAGFSRLLSWLLARHHGLTVALLTGFMLGAMRKIWPFKETLQTVVIRGKVHVLAEKNVLPASLDGEALLALGLALAGVLVVLGLEWAARRGRA
ncbi:DUF368 domain-containing protein [Desulfocurvus sp. DL9XJH121]